MFGIFLLIKIFSFTSALDITRAPSHNPQPIQRKLPIMDAIRSYEYFILFGGLNSQDLLFNDIWNYSTITHTWNQMFSMDGNDPSIFYLAARYGGGAFWNHISNEYCIWGGMSIRGQLNDLWCFDLIDYIWRKYETTGAKCKARYNFGYTSWNESNTVMFAILGGLTIEHTSYDLYM